MENEKPLGESAPNQVIIGETYSQSQHTFSCGDQNFHYTAIAGTILLKEEDLDLGEKPKAAIFYIAYTLDSDAESEKRPVTFSFNGGPGSSSVWMHLGLLGPRRVELDEEGKPFPPPYQLTNNEFSLLTHSDLVFIDPVSTGYSRTVPKEKADQFHTVKKDIESVAEFIRLWVTRNKRWNSPKFLIGESYGTTRAAGLVEYLQNSFGMYLNGVMLISSILNFITAEFTPGNDLPYILFLPTYTATAWFHKKLKADLQKDLTSTLAKVKEFAFNEYSRALLQGNQLSAKDRTRIALKLSEYCGLPVEYIEQTNLRINIHRFVKQLRRSEHLTIGRLDSRFTGFDRDAAGEYNEVDPSYSAILGPFSSTLNDYIRKDLNYEVDTRYEILSNLHETWNYDSYQNQFVNMGENLRMAFQMNSNLKVIVCNGYFDLATPFFATEYTLNHIELPLEVQANIETRYYQSGHMMYIHLNSLKEISADLRKFIEKSASNYLK